MICQRSKNEDFTCIAAGSTLEIRESTVGHARNTCGQIQNMQEAGNLHYKRSLDQRITSKSASNPFTTLKIRYQAVINAG